LAEADSIRRAAMRSNGMIAFEGRGILERRSASAEEAALRLCLANPEFADLIEAIFSCSPLVVPRLKPVNWRRVIGTWQIDLARPDSLVLSPGMLTLFGIAAEAWDGRSITIFERIHPDDRVESSNAYWRSVSDRECQSYTVVYRVRHEAGWRWVYSGALILRDADGKATSLVGIVAELDRDELPEAKFRAAVPPSVAKLRLGREHMSVAQRISASGSAEIDLATGIAIWSEALFQLTGSPTAPFSPSLDQFLALVHPDDRCRVRHHIEADIRGNLGPAFEFSLVRPDGTVRLLRRYAELHRDESGRATRMTEVYLDVTPRIEIEAEMKARDQGLLPAKAHLDVAQRVARVGSFDRHLRSGHVSWSDQGYRLLGYEPGAVTPGRDSYLANIHPDDLAKVNDLMDRIFAGEEVAPLEFRVKTPDGSTLWVRREGKVIFGEDGTPQRVFATLLDITELRRVEDERARLQEQITHVQKLESLGALSGGIAHDFNNLLTSILGSATLLREDASLPPDTRLLAQAVVRAAEQGAELTRRLLSFARRQMLRPVAIDVGSVALDLETLLRRTIGNQIDLAIRVDRDIWPAIADKGQLEAAIINLAVNARDAMPDGGALTIGMANTTFGTAFVNSHTGAAPGDYVAIAVRDTGTGMAPDVLDHAFEPFFTTKQEGHGTGLGLAMVYGFVKQSGGYVTLDSQLDQGTTVTLYLPRSLQTAQRIAEPPGRSGTRLSGDERVLLVDDDEMVRAFVKIALERLGYRVAVARDARDALAQVEAAAQPFDLLLADLMLPGGMNGRQLAEAIRRHHPDQRVLFASGYTEDVLIQQGRLDPGQSPIAKPFDGGALAQKVREVLDT
jgi:PAS domain S-box-containing protein